jgi:uncharacterized membrane protein YozB (DUF420 family)
MTLVEILPHVTAGLNALAGVLILIGLILIKSGDRVAHKKVMSSAMVVSALFLAAYLLHHFLHPLHAFPGEGMIRPIYFTLLVSHVLLAVAVTPMVIITFLRGRRALATGDTAKHRALARWTFPIWLYVSVTGIIVYWLLYHVYV